MNKLLFHWFQLLVIIFAVTVLGTISYSELMKMGAHMIVGYMIFVAALLTIVFFLLVFSLAGKETLNSLKKKNEKNEKKNIIFVFLFFSFFTHYSCSVSELFVLQKSYPRSRT